MSDHKYRAQAGEIGRAPDFTPGRAHGICLAMSFILVNYGAVPGVFQVNGYRGFAFHGDGFADDGHRLPSAFVLVLRRVGRVGVIDIEVFTIGAEDGQSPGSEIVVADGNAGKGRQADRERIPHDDERSSSRAGSAVLALLGPSDRARLGCDRRRRAGGIVFEVRLISAQPVIAKLTGAWPEIGDKDAGVVAALAADDFATSQEIDSAQPGVVRQGPIDPARLQGPQSRWG